MAEQTKAATDTAAVEAGDVHVVNFTDLEGTQKDKAVAVYDRIAQIGGFGSLGADFVGGRPALDLTGLHTNAADRSENARERSEDARRRLSEIKKLLK